MSMARAVPLFNKSKHSFICFATLDAGVTNMRSRDKVVASLRERTSCALDAEVDEVDEIDEVEVVEVVDEVKED